MKAKLFIPAACLLAANLVSLVSALALADQPLGLEKKTTRLESESATTETTRYIRRLSSDSSWGIYGAASTTASGGYKQNNEGQPLPGQDDGESVSNTTFHLGIEKRF